MPTAAARGRWPYRSSRGPPPPVIRDEAEAVLRRMLSGSDNHLTLAECRDRLAAETGLQVHPWTVELRRMGPLTGTWGSYRNSRVATFIPEPCRRSGV